MAKRTKKVVQNSITGEQMEQAMSDFSLADAKIVNITSKMDVEINRIREKYQDELQKWSQLKEASFDTLQAYATENRDELFARKKSMDTVHGVFGFRIGTPKLKTLKGFTWEAVANMLKEFLPDYIRVKEEVAKDKLLDDRDNPEVSKMFSKVGICVIQEETFFVQPKKEEAAA